MKSIVILSSLITLASCSTELGPVVPQSEVERKMLGLLEKFDRWDENGDEHLTANELRDAERIGGAPIEKIMNFYDTNRDKKISFDEAQRAYHRASEAEKMM